MGPRMPASHPRSVVVEASAQFYVEIINQGDFERQAQMVYIPGLL